MKKLLMILSVMAVLLLVPTVALAEEADAVGIELADNVTFYALNGKFASGAGVSDDQKTYTYSDKVLTPTANATGYTFDTWHLTNSKGTAVSIDTYTFEEGKTYKFYASYKLASYTFTVNANGGKYSSGATTASKSVTYSKTVGTLGTPTRSGYMFIGYYTAKTGGSKITASSIVKWTKNLTVYARWTPSYKLTVSANGGTIAGKASASKTVGYGQTVGTLTAATRTGYKFLGYYTAKTGGSKITAASVVKWKKALTIYAHWQALKYTLTENANGGKISGKTSATKKVTFAAKVGTLATPTRSGYKFAGWYTAKTGGSKITAATVVKWSKNLTLYARWTKK